MPPLQQQKQIEGLTREAVARGHRHHNILTALVATVRRLKEDAMSAQDDIGSLAAELRVLSNTVARVASAQQTPLDEWYAEVKKAFLFLMDQVRYLVLLLA